MISITSKSPYALQALAELGRSGAGHIRCAYANSLPKIEEALNRLEAFLKSLKTSRRKIR